MVHKTVCEITYHIVKINVTDDILVTLSIFYLSTTLISCVV